MKKFKEMIADLPLDKQEELIEWNKKRNHRVSLLITVLVLIPSEMITFLVGYYIGFGWIH